MKHIILFGLLLAFTTSCKNAPTSTTSEEFKVKEVKRLLAEANDLWMPPADSTFLSHNNAEHVSINDKEIWEKLDSALTLDPSNIKVYTGRTGYLMACKKFKEVLSTLREAEKTPLSMLAYGQRKPYWKIIMATALPHKRIIAPQIRLTPS